MSSSEINLLMILLILIAMGLVGLASRHLRPWFLWIIPIYMLLLHGLFYSAVYISDSRDGMISNPLLFNAWNNILRGQSYLTVIMYTAAFIALQRKLGKKHG